MHKRTFLIAAASIIAAATLSAPAQSATWKHLGTKQVNWLLDRDTIHVGQSEGLFRKIQIRVRGNKLFMHRLKITFGNGAVQFVPLRFHFAQGTNSRVIDLRGDKRYIKRVTMIYSKPWNGQGRTKVRLFGRR